MHASTMNRGPGRVWGGLMAALALLALLLGAPVRAQEGAVAWGQQLVETQELSAEGLARFLQTQEKNAQLRPGTDPASDTWSGRDMNLTSKGSPYTLVLRATGVALADGDAGVRMQTGWVFDGKTTQLPMPGMAQKGLRAGQTVELVGVSTPVTLDVDRKGTPVVEFTAAANLRLERVQIDVWSGQRPSLPLEQVMSWMPMLFGVIALGFFLWLRRQ